MIPLLLNISKKSLQDFTGRGEKTPSRKITLAYVIFFGAPLSLLGNYCYEPISH